MITAILPESGRTTQQRSTTPRNRSRRIRRRSFVPHVGDLGPDVGVVPAHVARMWWGGESAHYHVCESLHHLVEAVRSFASIFRSDGAQ